ncbi:MAG: hypothetical protein QOD14_2064 [Solirubrobacterales bacterium]|jgi:uncharacterized protein (DUF488 family)|nr:hypothetical protein [Solirubrobacterales bacterium]
MAKPDATTIITVGHSNNEEQEFLDLLRGAGVELIADVRVNPRSRYPQFNRSALAGTMKAAGIGYAPLGADLGGRRVPYPDSVNIGWDVEAFRGYADHMASEQFEAGLEMLEDLARERRTAVMCAEADWTHCHRRLLADILTVRGWRVLHLGPTGSMTPHELTDFAVLEDGHLTYPAQQTSLGI